MRLRHLLCAVMCLSASLSLHAQTEQQYAVVERTSSKVKFFSLDGSFRGEVRVGSNPLSMVYAPGGRVAYVADVNSSYISVIDVVLHREIRRIRGLQTGFMTITPDGTKLAAMDLNRDTLVIFDLTQCSSSQCARTEVDLDPLYGGSPDVVDIGTPQIIANNTRAFLNTTAGLIVVDFTGAKVLIPTGEGTNPRRQSLALSSDGTKLMVLRQGPNRLLMHSAAPPFSLIHQANFSTAVFAFNTVPAAGDTGYVVRRISIPGGTAPAISSVDVSDSPTFGTLRSTAQLTIPDGFTPGPVRLSIDDSATHAVVTARDSDWSPNVNVIDLGAVDASPATAVLHSTTIPHVIQNVVLSAVPTQNAAAAPVITGVSVTQNGSQTGAPVNNQPFTVTISGSGFSSDGEVRIGSLDPVAPSSTSSTSLTVNVPAGQAAQGVDVVVTNRNGNQAVTERDESAALASAFLISNPSSFRPQHQVVVDDLGQASVSILNASTDVSVQKLVDVNYTSLGMTISPDGNSAYVSTVLPNTVQQVDLFHAAPGWSRQLAGPQSVGAETVAYGHTSTGDVIYTGSGSQLDTGFFSEALQTLDASSGAVVSSTDAGIADGNDSRGPVRSTADGRYVYDAYVAGDLTTPVNRLLVFDTQSGGAPTVMDASAAGISNSALNFWLSPDGHTLIGTDGTNVALSSLADPMHPAAPAYIAPCAYGANPVKLDTAFVVNSNLYTLDSLQGIVEIFPFATAATTACSDVKKFTIPRTASGLSSEMAVTPDERLAYLTVPDEDSVIAVDLDAVRAGASNPVITKMLVGLGGQSLAVRPGATTPVGDNPPPVQPTPNVTISFTTVASAGQTSVTTVNATDVQVPAGVQLGAVPTIYNITTTATFSGPVEVCFDYDPSKYGTQEADLRLLHEDDGVFVDVTTSQDFTAHRICGVVSHFSQFAVGIGSTSFLFQSLVDDLNQLTINAGTRRSLLAKAVAARASFDRKNNGAAVNQLTALQSELAAQAGKQISASDSQRLSDVVQTIINRLQ